MLGRSFLFVPGNRSDRFDKALSTCADYIILDLEDAISPKEKAKARDLIDNWFNKQNRVINELLIRVNGIDTSWYDDDIRLIKSLPIKGLVIPKVEKSEVINSASDALGEDKILVALLETVTGIINIRELASHKKISCIAFGGADFRVDSGIEGDERELDYIRTKIVLESQYAGLYRPIYSVTEDINNQARLESDVVTAKQFGFGGKLCIHPDQIDIVNKGFMPNASDIAWANNVISKINLAGNDAVAIDGKLIDKPIIERAKHILNSVISD